MIDIIIKDFPFPPSVNNHLVPAISKVAINSKGKLSAKGHFFKSKKHVNYAKQVNEWHEFYRRGISDLIDEIQDHKKAQGSSFALELSIILVTHKDRLLKIDADNHTKSAQDNLCRILDIDDRYIFKSSIEKVLSNSGREYAIINLRSFKISNENESRLKHKIR